MLSKRAEKILSKSGNPGGLNKLYSDDPYHSENNPNGYIKLSSADNILPRKLLNETLSDEIFKSFNRDDISYYPMPGGEILTRKIVAKFINKYCIKNLKNSIEYDDLTLVPGVTSASDLLSQTIFDENDVLVTFSPSYYRFQNDFVDRGLINIEHVNSYFSDINDFDLNIDLLDEKYQEIKNQGKNIKAVLLVNPRNPDGGIFTEKQIKPVIEWTIKKHDLYLILDEIYNKTIFENEEDFKSGISIIDDDDSIDKNKVIWMWGLSKIFSMPGLRAACIYTKNHRIKESVIRSIMFQGLNVITQHIVKELLTNDEFISNFFNVNQKLLKESRDYCVELIKQHSSNVKIMPSKSGFFLMINFESFMKNKTFENEEILQQKFIQNKVLLVTGKSLSMNQPGWFRIVFSATEKQTLKLGIQRIFDTLNNL